MVTKEVKAEFESIALQIKALTETVNPLGASHFSGMPDFSKNIFNIHVTLKSAILVEMS